MHMALAGVGGYFVADFAPWLWALCIFALIVVTTGHGVGKQCAVA